MKRLITFFFFIFVYGVIALAQTVGTLPTIYKVSQIIPPADAQAGCNWAVGLNNANAACANDVSYINALLATASRSNCVDLVFDVSVGIGAGIVAPVPSCVVLEGTGSFATGIFVLAGSNATAICNAYPGYHVNCNSGTASGTPPATAGSMIVRNLAINGNRANNSTSGDARCSTAAPYFGWCFDINVANLQYYELSNVYLYNSPTYGTLSSNVDRQVYRNVLITTPSLSNGNTDGIHMDGPFGTFDIEGVYCATGDDCIAANIIEGYGGNGGGGTISNVEYAGALSGFRTYCAGQSYTLGPVIETNLHGFLSNHSALDASTLVRLGYSNAGVPDCIQSIKITNADVSLQDWSFGTFTSVLVDVEDNVGDLELSNVRWSAPGQAGAWLNFTGASTVGNYVCTECTIYRNTSGSAAAFWGRIPSGATVKRLEMHGAAVVNEQGQSYAAIPYGFDVQTGGAVGTFVMTAMDPALTTSLLNGNEWSRITNFYGAGVSGYFRNTVYANLPPATFTGLSASISDSSAGGVFGATEAGGSPGHYAQLNSNGVNWTVTGK